MSNLASRVVPVITRDDSGTDSTTNRPLIAEEPLSIRVQGRPYAVVMRTPGEEKAHIAGFCLAEGIVDRLEDIAAIGFCDGEDTNVVTVTLKHAAAGITHRITDRREFVSQTGCGLCGKQLIDDLHQEITPVAGHGTYPAALAIESLESMSGLQDLRRKTLACHAASLYTINGELLAFSEDVGRHNALDKVIGTLFLEERLSSADLLVLSSRISYELVQKAARARIPFIIAVSRPTSLAVELAVSLNIAIAGYNDRDGFCRYTYPERFSDS
jgi:FdhD protein